MPRAFYFLPLVALANPAMAQQHQIHAMSQIADARPEAEDTKPAEGKTMDHIQMDHSQMNQGQIDRGEMGHSSTDNHAMVDEVPIPEVPPPQDAFNGPAFAADQFVGAEQMAASRADVVKKVSGTPIFWFQADRAEYRTRRGKDGYLWDVQGFYGGDINKFWFKSEGEGIVEPCYRSMVGPPSRCPS